MQRIANRLKTHNRDTFSATINKLKSDAKVLSDRFEKKKEKKINHENRRHSMGFTSHYSEKENIEQPTTSNRRYSNIFIPPSQSKDHSKKSSPICEIHQPINMRQNTQIFFEHKNYYSSLHSKYNMNAQKSSSNMHSYFDSFRSDETTLKHKLRQKWQELKKDVDKTFHSFNHRKAKKQQKDTKNIDTFKNIFEKQALIESPIKNKEDAPPMIDQKDPEPQITDIGTAHAQILEQKEDEIEVIHADDVKDENIKAQMSENEENEDPNHSTIYSVSHLQKSNEYWDFSVRQLKDKLLTMNVSIDQCIEKRDLIQKLKICQSDKIKNSQKQSNNANKIPKSTKFNRECPKEPQTLKSKQKLNKNKPSILFDSVLFDSRESKAQIIQRSDAWIQRWSYRRSFRQILNSVLDYKAVDRRYIGRGRCGDQNYALMMKCYKKAIVLIHPDKHVNASFEVKYKTAEMFKIVTSLCEKYRIKNETRKN